MNKHKKILFSSVFATLAVALVLIGSAVTAPVSSALIRLPIPPSPTLNIDPTNNQQLTWNTIDNINGNPDPTYGLVFYNVYYKEISPRLAVSWTMYDDGTGGTALVKMNLPFSLTRQLDPPDDPSNYGKTAQFYVVACNYQKPEVKFNPESSFILNGCSQPSNIKTIFLNSGDTSQPSGVSGTGIVRKNTATTYSVTLYPDPNRGQVQAVFDWGDGTTGSTPFITPAPGTGTKVSLSHSWTSDGKYNLRVKAKDSYSLESAWVNAVSWSNGAPGWTLSAPDEAGTVVIVDSQAPSVPTGVTARDCATDTSHNCYPTNGPQINVAWLASTDNGQVGGYKIYRNGTFLADADMSTYDMFYPDASAIPGTSYTYAVAAVDVVGNVSAKSAPVSAKIGLPDTQAPAAPNLTLKEVFSTQINLSWNVPTDDVGVVGYKIFRNGELIDTTTETSYNDHDQSLPAYYTTLESSTTYSYTVAAYDAAGNISPNSNSVSAKTLASNEPIVPPTDTTSDNNVTDDSNKTPPTTTDVDQSKKDKDQTIAKDKEQTTDKDQIAKDKIQTVKDQDQNKKVNIKVFKFTKNLKVGSKGNDVKILQQILINEGVFPNGKVTGIFDKKTKAAVINFQNKYKSEILTPVGLKKGNGLVGPTTRAKLNAIYKTLTLGVILPATTVPTITSISPASGPVGSKFTITGTGFTPTGNKVKFGELGVENDPSNSNVSADGTTLTFTVPGGSYLACWYSKPACAAPVYMTQPGIYDVSIINANGTSLPKSFTVPE